MKTLILLLPVLLVGCATPIPNINSVLDATLPPTFTGPINIHHKNPYTTIDIRGDGLKRGAEGWEWLWLEWKREGRASDGFILLGTK